MISLLEVALALLVAAVAVVSYIRSERMRLDALFAIGVLITAAGLAAHAWTTTHWSAALAVSFAELEAATEMEQ